MTAQTKAQHEQPDYLGALGLERAPFLDQIDDRFFYADPALMQRLDLLQHLTQFGDLLLGITGPAGSGKTTLLQQFMLRGNANWRLCRIDGAHVAQPSELIEKLAEALGQDVSADPERMRAALLRLCQTLQHNTQLPVVLIDNAERLPEPALKGLLELAGTAKETLKLIRVLLFSEPGLENRLTAAGMHNPLQPILHELEVPRFDEQQTASYLMYRLAVAGYSGDSPFSLTEIRAMHKAAGGLPAKLNVLAHETLMEKGSRLTSRTKSRAVVGTTAGWPRQRLMAMGIAGLALAATAGYFLLGQLTGWLTPSPSDQELALTLPPASLPLVDTDALPSETETLKDNNYQNLDETPINDQQIDLNDVSERLVAVTDAPPEQATPPPPAPPAEPVRAAAEPEATTAMSADAAPAPVVVATEPVSDPTPAPAPPRPELAESPAQLLPTPTPPDTPAPAEPQPAKESTTNDAPLGNDWLLARESGHFALQLLGVRSEEALKTYIDRHRIPAPVAYFRTEYKGGDWWVLVQGDYPTMAAARSGIANLPAKVRQAKPWPRSFATVQDDIKKVTP